MVVDSFVKLSAAELRVMVMSHGPDLKPLLNISAAYPDLAPELERTSEVLIPAVISRSMPTELEQLVNAILTVRANPSTADAEPPFPGRRVKFYGVQADRSTKALLNLKCLWISNPPLVSSFKASYESNAVQTKDNTRNHLRELNWNAYIAHSEDLSYAVSSTEARHQTAVS